MSSPSIAFEKAEKKIWVLMAEYKKDASRDEINQLTNNVMEVCKEYNLEIRSTTEQKESGSKAIATGKKVPRELQQECLKALFTKINCKSIINIFFTSK